MKKNNFYKILFLSIFWMCAVLLYIFLEMSIEELVAELYNYQGYNYNFVRIMIIAVSATVIGSAAIGSFEVLVFGKYLRKIPFGFSLIIKSIFYLSAIFILTSFATLVSYSFIIGKPLFDGEVLHRLAIYLRSSKLWAVTLYWGVMIMFAVFILQLSEKFGRGVLLNYLRGRYHRPKEEVRIFMFLDLTSSSLYAERLGHIKYSQLIQDCVYDLTLPVTKTGAKIYQYVGDEVVLTWDQKSGIEDNQCLKLFFEYEKAIQKRSVHYTKEYGMIPEFKAGMHLGHVTIVEIGELKKELAYHGDALNTTARIRSSCNEFDKKFLLSADLISLLNNIDDEYKVDSIGVAKLRGKENVVALFSVEENRN